MQKHLLAAILSAVFIALVGIGIIAPVMPIYATELGASGFALGVIVAGFSLSRGLLQPVVGGLADRHGKKRFMIAGLFIYAVMGYSYTLATSVEHLVAVRIVHGMGSAMIIPMAMAYIGDMSPEGQEGKYMGWLHISIFTGIGGGPVLGGFFLDFWGMNSAFYAMALLSFLSLLLVASVLPEQTALKTKENQGSMFSVFKRMLHSRRVIGILISRMSTMMIMIPTVAFLPVLMEKSMDAGGIEIGVVVASRTLVNAVLQTPFGNIADRWHKHRLIFIGSTIISIAMLGVPLSGSFINLVILFAFIGIGESISWPALGALATEEGREYGQGSMMGMFNMAMSAGLFFGAMGMGALTDLLGIAWAFYIVALILFLSTVVAVELIRNPKLNIRGGI
ncbi:MAG: MFS transporter [Desulfobacteraceae bacterium]|nr:MFS transporter [Desulfobacteraceae bacterium]